jgi:hypothetical protein
LASEKRHLITDGYSPRIDSVAHLILELSFGLAVHNFDSNKDKNSKVNAPA